MREHTPWLTTREAEDYTGYSYYTLLRARKDGRLAAHGTRRSIRYHVEDLDKFMRGEAPMPASEGVRF